MPYQIKNGIIYSGNAVTLTQAQYDALTTAEKNNGTVYYIYDSDAMIEAQEVGLDGGNVETLAGSVATFENSPSTAVHAEGEYILYQAQLYKVTSAIAVGEDLTVGSNIEATNLGNELNAGLIDEPVTITPASGFYIDFNMSRKIGNMYYLCFAIKKTSGKVSADSWTTIGTIDGLVLSKAVILTAAAIGSNGVSRAELRANGAVGLIVTSQSDGGSVTGFIYSN